MTTTATPASTPRHEKPWPGFPLFWHARGYWCKKHKGRQVPLGADAAEALRKWSRIEAGLKVQRRNTPKAVTVREVVNRFTAEQRERFKDGEIGPNIFAMYRRECVAFGEAVGFDRPVELLTATDFAERRRAALRRGPRALDRHIISVRAMFNWAQEQADMIDRPPRYGRGFVKTSAKMRRRAKNKSRDEHGEASWTPAELRKLINKSPGPLKAAILLAINGGMGSGDLAGLCVRHIDFKAGLIRYPRPKTEIDRWVPLWPETKTAIRAAIKARPKPEADALADRVFLTERGKVVARDVVHEDEGGVTKTVRVDRVGEWFKFFAKPLGLLRRKRGFYSLRSAFRSLAIGQPDEYVKVIMGHQLAGHDENYVRGILHELHKVTDQVRARVFEQ